MKRNLGLILFLVMSILPSNRVWSDAVGLSGRVSESKEDHPVQGLKIMKDSVEIFPKTPGQVEGIFKLDGNFNRPFWILLQGKEAVKTDEKGNFKVSVPFSSLETGVEFAAVGPLGELELTTVVVEISVDLTP